MIEFEATDATEAADVLVVHARGRLTRQDYRDVLAPRVQSLLEQSGTLRVMLVMDDTFEGWTRGAAWENTLLDIKHRRDFEKVAMVGAPKWEEWCVKVAAALLVKGQLATFPLDERAQAWEWLYA